MFEKRTLLIFTSEGCIQINQYVQNQNAPTSKFEREKGKGYYVKEDYTQVYNIALKSKFQIFQKLSYLTSL